jgi:ribosomal protein S18 acetylase RimI-like enzyme
MGDIIIKEVLTRKDRRDFIYLPSKIHKDHKNWLPPIYMDEWELYDKKKNKSYQYADAILLLAYKNNKLAGRIMGLVNNRYNEIHNEKHGRFCFMECYEDREVFHELLKSVEDWARAKGMVKMVGPLGFSDKDPQGFQTEGFETPYFMTAPTNHPYMPKMMDDEGYVKNVDLVNYIAPIPKIIPEVYIRTLSRVAKSPDLKIVEFTSKKELKPYIVPVLELMNQTFAEIYGFVPLTDKEKKDFAARYLPILDPRFIKVVENKDGLVGFAIGMPDISEGLRKAKGKLFPFGIFMILRESRRSKKLLMMLGGVKKEFRGLGIDALMAVKILETSIKSGMEVTDSHLVLEDNRRMRAEYERIGGTVVKKYRIYQKDLI